MMCHDLHGGTGKAVRNSNWITPQDIMTHQPLPWACGQWEQSSLASRVVVPSSRLPYGSPPPDVIIHHAACLCDVLSLSSSASASSAQQDAPTCNLAES